MRWKRPKHDERKKVKKFAWFPTVVDGHLIWLEFYYVHYRFNAISYLGEWESIRFELKN